MGKMFDVLVITDHFTKLAHAFPCPTRQLKLWPEAVEPSFSVYMVFPQRIHSDKGSQFEVS